MGIDPNMEMFVRATAFFTAGAFTIFALNLIALVLQRVLS
jgi:hypothetical protein